MSLTVVTGYIGRVMLATGPAGLVVAITGMRVNAVILAVAIAFTIGGDLLLEHTVPPVVRARALVTGVLTGIVLTAYLADVNAIALALIAIAAIATRIAAGRALTWLTTPHPDPTTT